MATPLMRSSLAVHSPHQLQVVVVDSAQHARLGFPLLTLNRSLHIHNAFLEPAAQKPPYQRANLKPVSHFSRLLACYAPVLGRRLDPFIDEVIPVNAREPRVLENGQPSSRPKSFPACKNKHYGTLHVTWKQ